MPTKNEPLDLAQCQLFIKAQETGDTMADYNEQDIYDPAELKANAVKYLNQINMPEIALHLDATDLSWAQYTEQYLRPMLAAYNEWLNQIVIVEQQACMAWAKENRRKWLHIGRTTKKARTRKKYARLIWRDYKAANPTLSILKRRAKFED